MKPDFQNPRWAWAPYKPDDSHPWNLALAGHLMRRAGFGANWNQLQQALTDGPSKTIDRLLTPPPDLEAFDRQYRDLGASVAISDDAGSYESSQLWLYRMAESPYPLQEKMTLFWHIYFATAGARVGRVALVEQRLRLLRKHALGRFDAMLSEVCRDPATLIALGAQSNHKGMPAEGFARALLGLYTLGPGAFSPGDVRETARAFTGCGVLRGEYHYRAYEHDDGAKTILGKQGNFNGDDALRVLLSHPATPLLVARKLYRWLVTETAEPGDSLVAALAEPFAKDYDIAKLAGTILHSNLFFSAAAYRQRVKGPVEFALGIATAFEVSIPAAQLHWALAGLGQDLLEPPTREGWPGGRRWLNQFTLVGRSNLAAALLAGANPQAVAEKYGQKDAGRFFADLLVQSDAPAADAHAIACSPEFQLA